MQMARGGWGGPAAGAGHGGGHRRAWRRCLTGAIKAQVVRPEAGVQRGAPTRLLSPDGHGRLADPGPARQPAVSPQASPVSLPGLHFFVWEMRWAM